ncbi:MAG TPA: hypothetical protein VF629_07705 [Hymenobacter sp.]|jgi:hypothetical protein|uniref:hypothetical protein n=1 Tax=Hymenobacter sp. TaxID=1898978 RepID=UPI002ED97A06
MPFEVLPVLEAMSALYEKPRDRARFDAYLALLNGNTQADLAVPVMHYNPMAKQPLVAKLHELMSLGAEAIAAETLQKLNAAGAAADEPIFQVALNLADDLQGGWTNRYTTDYANKFQLRPLLQRRFCTPVFWASEAYTADLVRRRTLAQAWRTRYQARHPRLKTVAEHLAQEQFVTEQLGLAEPMPASDMRNMLARYDLVRDATDSATLLTFLYGDEAAAQLGHPAWGAWPRGGGFRLARALAAQGRGAGRNIV